MIPLVIARYLQVYFENLQVRTFAMKWKKKRGSDQLHVAHSSSFTTWKSMSNESLYDWKYFQVTFLNLQITQVKICFEKKKQPTVHIVQLLIHYNFIRIIRVCALRYTFRTLLGFEMGTQFRCVDEEPILKRISLNLHRIYYVCYRHVVHLYLGNIV